MNNPIPTILSIPLLALTCCSRIHPQSNSNSRDRDERQPPEVAKQAQNEHRPSKPSDVARQLKLQNQRELHARTLRDYEKKKIEGTIDPGIHALAAFSTGFKLNYATIRLSQVGCFVEINQNGKRYRQHLDDFNSCRLAEVGGEGRADVQSVEGREGNGVLIVDLQARPESHLCVRKTRSLRITSDGPRISARSAQVSMCNYRDIDPMNYETQSWKDVPVPEMQ